MAEERGNNTNKPAAILTALTIAVGATLLACSITTGLNIGSEWLSSSANTPWHMNNYIVINAKDAYIYFGLAALAIGGLATGIATSAFFGSRKSLGHKAALICTFFVSIVLTGLGFNTLDFMSGNFYWTNLTYPPPIHVPLIGAVDVWNYYFFFFVVPLWLGGFIMGTIAVYIPFTLQRKHSTFEIEVRAISHNRHPTWKNNPLPPVAHTKNNNKTTHDKPTNKRPTNDIPTKP